MYQLVLVDLLIRVELLLSCPLLGSGEEAASTSFVRMFSNATTAILVNSSSMFSPGGRKTSYLVVCKVYYQLAGCLHGCLQGIG